MTETKQFIEDAIKGGWHRDQRFRLAAGYIKFTTTDADGFLDKVPVAEALINPFVWQAVSKTRDWNKGKRSACPSCGHKMSVDWRYYMHQLIEELAMGDTIEEALKKIK